MVNLKILEKKQSALIDDHIIPSLALKRALRKLIYGFGSQGSGYA